MVTLVVLGVISVCAIRIGLKIIDKRLNIINKDLRKINNKSTDNFFSIKDMDITQSQILEFQKEQIYEMENIRKILESANNSIDKLYQYNLNTREIIQDNTEVIKNHVLSSKKDLQWSYINNPVKVVFLDGKIKE
ncbi:hypothetical protein [Clostridium senegalense]|uniref:hypothetical protein n=1 Tax=Clostridium senegalense TaxID=1465809 RepID=UPI000287D44C|nr:hypothetical protein [Clostridium senegalense]